MKERKIYIYRERDGAKANEKRRTRGRVLQFLFYTFTNGFLFFVILFYIFSFVLYFLPLLGLFCLVLFRLSVLFSFRTVFFSRHVNTKHKYSFMSFSPPTWCGLNRFKICVALALKRER